MAGRLPTDGNAELRMNTFAAWDFEPEGRTRTHKAEELSFDGRNPAKLAVNEHWVISIDPDSPPDEV